jgi:hypothetical protein
MKVSIDRKLILLSDEYKKLAKRQKRTTVRMTAIQKT